MNNKKQRNRLFTMLLLVMAILMPYGGAWAQTKPSSGNGEVDKPYKISTAAELAWFRDQVNCGNNTISATLTKDIDLSEFCHAKDGTTYTDELSWTPINWYQGTFDGNGKTISNLYINATSNYTGFFGYAYAGSIKNITFDNARVKNTGGYNFGILVGNAGSCIIENIKTLANCSVEGENYVGGIAGVANGNISNCENRATVKGIRSLGGVVAAYSGNSITSCANYGVVTGSGESVGGIAGYFNSGTIQNSANYGDVTGTDNVGNLIGLAEECNLNNVLGTGNVTATSAKLAGLLVGNIRKSSSTASGILAYNSSAKLTINGTEQTGDAVKAIGGGSLTSAEKIMAFTEEQLKSGLVANQLQKNVSGSARWGQKLNTNDYPLLGSADEVYLDGNLTMNCLGELEGTGTFTNTKPAQEGTFTFKHGDSPKHHKFVAATCTTDGNIEYWECNLCHKSFSNEQMTQMVSSLVVVSATGHEYDENDKCTKCQQEIPFLKLGNNSITIGKVQGEREKISGYNLYKYTAPEDGTLEVTANSNRKNTYGTLWESRTAASCLTSDNSGNFPDFKITYTVTKGTTYYIGAREFFGKAIEGEVKLNVKMNGLDRELPAGMTGKGTEAEPFVLKTADHLAWFRDCVNECNTLVCAKIADEVKEIDMSTVCHKADTEKQVAELSWTPIGNFDNNYQGTFDGNGKTISNLYINASSDFAGFFGYLAGGNIKNITFDNAKVNSTGIYYTGILAGYAGSCIFENIKTLGNCSVEGKDITGGIAGIAVGNISNCENHAEVKGTKSLGGILGMYYGSDNSITSCANYGAVTGTYSQVGGMVGYFDSGTIQNSANYGDITGKDNVGNLIGEGIICNLNNVLGTGNVTATSDTERAGLLVGGINNSSSTASGILAYNSSAKLTINGAEQTGEAVKAIGEGSLTYPEGVNEADVIKAFTKQQIKSGEVAYLLAEGKVLGEQVWGQQLGKDQYPVPGSDYKVIKAAQGDKDANGNYTYWATFSNQTNDVTLSVPSESGRTLNVYNATVSGGKLTLTQRNNQVAKEEGVLLKTDGEYVNAKTNKTNELTAASSDENHLVATPAEAQTVTADADCKLYRLTYGKAATKEHLGFYLSVDRENNSNNGTSLKATPGKAYLQISEKEAKDPSSAAPARSFVFGGGNETTGIEGITIMGTDVQRHGTIEGIFDLQGRKISNPTKGIYIKNNKKVVIK
ncbi:hypothetical protein [Segatella copri]|uniref:GLUG domain-containing protein n=1 Tax=Segatella copri TaxID=165179 RepID=A0AA90UUL1_9BACT|nr:hypothetical protein [Segatella copri]MQN82626.1 hypothetical protein [Segatella copri]